MIKRIYGTEGLTVLPFTLDPENSAMEEEEVNWFRLMKGGYSLFKVNGKGWPGIKVGRIMHNKRDDRWMVQLQQKDQWVTMYYARYKVGCILGAEYLADKEVHHKDFNGANDRYSNLVTPTMEEHRQLHKELSTVHGTHNNYSKHGCRCFECTQAYNTWLNNNRIRQANMSAEARTRKLAKMRAEYRIKVDAIAKAEVAAALAKASLEDK